MKPIKILQTSVLFLGSALILGHTILYLSKAEPCPCYLDEEEQNCNMDTYTLGGMKTLFKNSWKDKETTIAFLGDSHMRFLYYCFNEFMINDTRRIRDFPSQHKIFEYFYSDIHLKVKYISQDTLILYKLYRNLNELKIDSNYPDILIINCNLHPILESDGSLPHMHSFRQNLTLYSTILENLPSSTHVLWYVQPPVHDDADNPRNRILRNYRIERYNNITEEVLSRTRIKIWHSSRQIAHRMFDIYTDSHHSPEEALHEYRQILFNYHSESLHRDINYCTQRIYSSTLHIALVLFCAVGNTVYFACMFAKNLTKTEDGQGLETPSQLPEAYEEVLPLSINSFNKFPVRILTMIIVIIIFFSMIGLVYIVASTPIVKKSPEMLSMDYMQINYCVLFVLSLILKEAPKEEDNVNANSHLGWTGVLVVVFILFDWTSAVKVTSSHVSLLEGSLLLAFGYAASKSYVDDGSIFPKVKEILGANLLWVCLRAAVKVPYSFHVLVPLLSINMLVALIVTPLPPYLEKIDGTFLSFFPYYVKAMVITLINQLIYIHRVKIFNSDLLKSVFATQEDTLEEWLEIFLSHWYFFCVGFIMFILVKQLLTLRSVIHSKLKRRNGIFLDILFTGIMAGSFVHLKFSGTYSAAVLLSICTILLVIIWEYLHHFLPHRFRLLEAIGSCWMEIYLLHSHIAMAYEGTATLLLIPFNEHLNYLILFLHILFFSNHLSKLISIVLRFNFFNRKNYFGIF